MAVQADITEENTIRHMAIVGGQLDGADHLVENDRTYRYTLLKVLRALGVPLDAGYAPALECSALLGGQTAIINTDPRWGGKDFLKVETQTDLLMFANISYRLSSGGDFYEHVDKSRLSTAEQFVLASNQVSDENLNDALWSRKIRESGAKIVVAVGGCDYPPEKIAGDDYIILRNAFGNFQGILIHRDYLRDMKAHFTQVQSPLASVAQLAGSFTDIVEFRRDDHRLTFSPVMPDELVVTPASRAPARQPAPSHHAP